MKTTRVYFDKSLYNLRLKSKYDKRTLKQVCKELGIDFLGGM
jgi:hypothetical protein